MPCMSRALYYCFIVQYVKDRLYGWCIYLHVAFVNIAYPNFLAAQMSLQTTVK